MRWPDFNVDSDPRLAAKVSQVLETWESTPYVVGQRARGYGTNCVGFVTGVLDDLYGSVTQWLRYPDDLAFTNPAGAVRAMENIMAQYPQHRILPEGVALEPADILVVSRPVGGPTHAIFVGAGPNELWQSAKKGVSQTSTHRIRRTWPKLVRVFRMNDRENWLES